MERLEIRASRWQYILFLLVDLGLVGMGVILVMRGGSDDLWVGGGSIVFFGALLPLLIRQMVDPRPRLVLDAQGITDRTIGVGTIRWDDIRDAQLMRVSSTRFISLDVRNTDAYLARLSAPKRFFSNANRAIGYSPLTINLSGLAVDAERLLEMVRQRSRGSASES